MTEPLEDLYALLGLDPTIEDSKTIDAAIERKRLEWNKDSPDPREKRKNEHNRNRVREIRGALAKDGARYRQFAIDEAKRREADDLALIKDLLETLAGLDAITPAHLDGIGKAVGRRIPAAKIAAAAKAAGLEAKPQHAAAAKVNDPAGMAAELELLRKRDLYDFLDAPPSSSLTVLQEKAVEVHRFWSTKNKTAVQGAATALAARAEICFKTPAAKRNYDAHLVDIRLKPLEAHITLLGEGGVIAGRNVALLVSRGVKYGVSAEVAAEFIRNFALASKFEVRGTARPSDEAPLRLFCGACGTLALKSDDKHCRNCSESLHRPCPNPKCEATVYSTDNACTACGFKAADGPWVDKELAKAQKALATGDHDAAEAAATGILARWPGFEPALSLIVNATAAAVKAKIAEGEFERLNRERRLAAAETALQKVIGLVGAKRCAARTSALEAARGKAAEAVQTGREALHRRDLGAAQTHFEAALLIEVDQADALAELARLPVEGLKGLGLVRKDGRIELNWAAGLPGTRYQVLRRASDPLVSYAAEHLIGEIDKLRFIDTAAPRGVPLYYGVVAVRRGNQSPMVYAGPTLSPAKVKDFRALASDRQAVLTWRAPPGAIAVELGIQIEKVAAPTRRLQGGSFVHDALRNGAAVDYFMVAVFADPNGGEIRSDPVHARIVPSAPMEPVKALSATRRGRLLELKWPPPSQGRVEILMLENPLSCSMGARISEADLLQLGKLIPITSSQSGFTQIDLNAFPQELAKGLARFAIFVSDGSAATVGASATVGLVDPVTDVTSSISGSYVVLKWTWPVAGDIVKVGVRFDTAPMSPEDPIAVYKDVTRSAYLADGCFRILSPDPRAHHISIWTGQSGLEDFSEPVNIVEAMGMTRQVRYQVSRKNLNRKQMVIQLSGPPGTVLRGVEVHGRDSYAPLSRADGTLIVQTGSIELADGRAEIGVPDEFTKTGMFIKVFCRDPSDVRLVSADKGGSKL